MTTILFYFYDKKRELAIGDTVTVAQAKYGEISGERATLVNVTARYAEFLTTTGSRIKVYAQSLPSGAKWYRGHRLPAGWKKDGWFVDIDAERAIVQKHPQYLAFVKKTNSYEWRDR